MSHFPSPSEDVKEFKLKIKTFPSLNTVTRCPNRHFLGMQFPEQVYIVLKWFGFLQAFFRGIFYAFKVFIILVFIISIVLVDEFVL